MVVCRPTVVWASGGLQKGREKEGKPSRPRHDGINGGSRARTDLALTGHKRAGLHSSGLVRRQPPRKDAGTHQLLHTRNAVPCGKGGKAGVAAQAADHGIQKQLQVSLGDLGTQGLPNRGPQDMGVRGEGCAWGGGCWV